MPSDVVLEARPWPRGTSRPNFMALALASGPVALASKVQALALALRAVLIILALPIQTGCQMYCVCPLLLCGRIWLKALAEGHMALALASKVQALALALRVEALALRFWP